MPSVDPKSDPYIYSPESRPSSTHSDLPKNEFKLTDVPLYFLRHRRITYLVIGCIFVLAMVSSLIILLSLKTMDQVVIQSSTSTLDQVVVQSSTSTMDQVVLQSDTSTMDQVVFQSCPCKMAITLDVTYSLTSDEFEWEKEYVTYYMPMFNPYLDYDMSTCIYHCDSNDHCAKWPTRTVKQTTGQYLKNQKVLKQKQVHGVLDDLGAIILNMVGSLWALCETVVETDFSKCMNYASYPYNNLVFMGNPSKNPPPKPMNLNVSGYTYNGSTTFDYVHHFAHGLDGKNRLVVVLLKNESYDQWNQTNLQQWLDAGIKVIPYNANQTALTYEIRNQLLCDKYSVGVYTWPGDYHNLTSLRISTSKSSRKTTFETTTPTLTTKKNANRG